MGGEIIALKEAVGLAAEGSPELKLAGAKFAEELRFAIDGTRIEGAAANSMTPKAYKVLTEHGRSPWAPRVLWSLPKQADDGSWIPGEWKTARNSAYMPARAWEAIPVKPGIYVTDHPIEWDSNALGTLAAQAPQKFRFDERLRICQQIYPKTQVFEVEIGDAKSARQWSLSPSDDFAAKRVRLLRPVSRDELDEIFRPKQPDLPRASAGPFFVEELAAAPLRALNSTAVEKLTSSAQTPRTADVRLKLSVANDRYRLSPLWAQLRQLTTEPDLLAELDRRSVS